MTVLRWGVAENFLKIGSYLQKLKIGSKQKEVVILTTSLLVDKVSTSRVRTVEKDADFVFSSL